MILAFLRGLGFGLLAGFPLGPASAAVVDASLRRGPGRALALGAGAALVDFAYFLSATTGTGLLLSGNPDAAETLRIVGGVLLAGFGIVLLVRKPPDQQTPLRRLNATTALAALGTGIAISGLNPALATTWLVLSSTVFAGIGTVEALVAAAGVFLGTFTWFVGLTVGVGWSRHRLGGSVVWMHRLVAAGLVAYGAALLVRPLLAG